MRAYVSTKIIQAEPSERDGVPGYTIHYPDGYRSWAPKDTFERTTRPITPDEIQIVETGTSA